MGDGLTRTPGMPRAGGHLLTWLPFSWKCSEVLMESRQACVIDEVFQHALRSLKTLSEGVYQ